MGSGLLLLGDWVPDMSYARSLFLVSRIKKVQSLMIGTGCVVYEKEGGTVKTREPLIYCSLAVVRRQSGVNATIYDYRALFNQFPSRATKMMMMQGRKVYLNDVTGSPNIGLRRAVSHYYLSQEMLPASSHFPRLSYNELQRTRRSDDCPPPRHPLYSLAAGSSLKAEVTNLSLDLSYERYNI